MLLVALPLLRVEERRVVAVDPCEEAWEEWVLEPQTVCSFSSFWTPCMLPTSLSPITAKSHLSNIMRVSFRSQFHQRERRALARTHRHSKEWGLEKEKQEAPIEWAPDLFCLCSVGCIWLFLDENELSRLELVIPRSQRESEWEERKVRRMRAWEGLGQKVSKESVVVLDSIKAWMNCRFEIWKSWNWNEKQKKKGGISKKDGDFKGLRRILESRPPKKQAGQISRSSRNDSTVYVLLSLLFFSWNDVLTCSFSELGLEMNSLWILGPRKTYPFKREERREMGGQKSFYFLWTWENWNNQYWIGFSWFSAFFLEEIRNSVSFERVGRGEQSFFLATFFLLEFSRRSMRWALRWHHQQMR